MTTIWHQDVAADLRGAETAYRSYLAAMLEFQACCIRFDWQAADEIRQRVEALHDAFLEHIAAAYKRMEHV